MYQAPPTPRAYRAPWIHLTHLLLLTLPSLAALTGCKALGWIKTTIEPGLGPKGELNVGGNVGGGGDSVALWLAIGALTLSPILGGLFYPMILRPLRRWLENTNGRNRPIQDPKT